MKTTVREVAVMRGAERRGQKQESRTGRIWKLIEYWGLGRERPEDSSFTAQSTIETACEEGISEGASGFRGAEGEFDSGLLRFRSW